MIEDMKGKMKLNLKVNKYDENKEEKGEKKPTNLRITLPYGGRQKTTTKQQFLGFKCNPTGVIQKNCP